MVGEEKHHSLLIDNIFKGFIALIVLIASSYMIIAGLNDPNRYTSVNTAFEIWAGGVFFFFSALYIASLFRGTTQMILIVLTIAVLIFISVKYYIFALAFAFLLLQIFLLTM
jgi:Ca2+/Na+ antiporter